jgi:hypothetical protein
MKICVINFSGNVGKTLVAAQLLQPRLQAPIVSVESINGDAGTDGVEVERIRAQRFAAVQDRVLTEPSIIVDVGASNVEDFLERMAASRGSAADFDRWIVPVVRARKQQQDTINTLKALRAMGVPANKVRVVFNSLDHHDTIEEDFAAICALGGGEYFELKPEAVLMYNEVFDRIKGSGRSLADVVRDDTDYKAMIAQATSQAERHAAAARLAIRRLALGAQDNLDQGYQALTA